MKEFLNVSDQIDLCSVLELLIGNNECCIISYEEAKDVFKSELKYVYNDLTIFGLDNYSTLKDLLLFIDTKSEVAEIIGAKHFVMDIRAQFTNKKEKLSQFYLPLKDNEKTNYFQATLLKKEEKRYLLLEQNTILPGRYEALYASLYKDQLTGLFNMNTLKMHIDELGGIHYFGFLDLDNFKKINDTLTHQVGDELLYRIALVLMGISDEHVIFYRRSGDEFIFMTNDLGLEETKELVNRIQKEISEIDFFRFDIRASLGYAKFEKGIGYDVIDTINASDLGMYKSKQTRNARPIYISPEEIKDILKNSSLSNELEQASKTRKR